jgi:outer membrane protein assembly factor BamA
MMRIRWLPLLFLGICMAELSSSESPVSGQGSGGGSVAVLPYGYYEPVTGFSAGGSFLDFNAFGSGTALALDGTYSFAGFYAAQARVFASSAIPRTALSLRLGCGDYARRFFGLSDSTSLDSALTYSDTNIQAEAEGSTSLKAHLKLDASVLLDSSEIGPYEGQALPSMPGSGGGIMTLARMEIARDTRDFGDAPRRGDYEAVGCGLSQPLLGSAYSFETLDLDLRYFHSFFGAHVIAARIAAKQCFGEAPFYARPDFGGATLGRGFQSERFIGNSGAYGQLEYRFPIVSKIGGDLFLDAGQVGEGYQSFTLNGIRLCGGAGLRFASSKLPILAIDVGFDGEALSREGFAVIVRTGHAF